MRIIADPKVSEDTLVSSNTQKLKVFADLQIHSKYSRATSKDLSFDNLEKYARIKGIDLLGTGDFQHPLQYEAIKKEFKEDDKGILWSSGGFPFIWQTEISLMFSQGGKRRAVHLLVFAPCGESAEKIKKFLESKGRTDYDGRPIFGINCFEFVREMKKIDDMIEVIPAHCMTPWFGLFGSGSGFNSLYECFGEEIKHIYAVESGMSADPEMLWRLKEKINIVSFSDAHSFWPFRLGREATIFELNELSYKEIIKAIRTGVGLVGTIETPPEYGKYHYDGHRNCGFSCGPDETKKINGICPKCKGKLTIGVDYRIEELAKEEKGFKPENWRMFYKLIPLQELIGFVYGTSLTSKKCWNVYNLLIEKFGNEFRVLLDVSGEELIGKGVDEKLVEVILLNREGKLKVKPGYDGEYGVIEMSDWREDIIGKGVKKEGKVERQGKLV